MRGLLTSHPIISPGNQISNGCCTRRSTAILILTDTTNAAQMALFQITLHHLPPPLRLQLFTSSLPTITKRSRLASAATVITSSSSTTTTSSTTDVDAFWQWARQRGALPSPPVVKPGLVPEGLGLVAQKNISKKEQVLEIPKSLWINSDTVSASDIGQICQGLKPWISIALFLLREKALASSSPWSPYLRILPLSTHSPIFWSEDELLEIQGTQLLSTTEGVKDYVQSEFHKVEEEIILPNRHLFPSAVTFKDFLWAFGILRSRAFPGLRGENLVLIPLADLVRFM